MYGSSLMLVTRMPRDSRIAAREAAAMPFPREETTPPVTKTYLAIYLGRVGMEEFTRKNSGRRELRAIPEQIQRLRIGQRLEIFRLAAVDHVAHRQLDDFSALGPRDVGDLQDLGRDVAAGGVIADLLLDLGYQGVSQRMTLAQPDE